MVCVVSLYMPGANASATLPSFTNTAICESRTVSDANIMAKEIGTDGSPSGAENRRALATASDYPEAAELVAKLYDEFGFDTVNIGPLDESWRVERDRPAYVVRQNAAELKDNLARAPRTI